MELVIGIDGGGSKTLALAARVDGTVVGRGTAGASNYQGVGLPAALAALDEALDRALNDALERGRDQAPERGLAGAGREATGVRAVCLGLAGAGRAEDQARFLDWAAGRMPRAVARVANDAELVLAAGSPEGWGLAVIAGTGSIAYGRDRAGRTGRAGGWGPLLGDEGSGYAIGRAALRAAAAAHDGRAPETLLLPAILRHWSLPDAPALVARAYRPPLAPSEVAALAVIVAECAAVGDETSSAILANAGRDLAVTAAAVARRLGLSGPTPCALAGSALVKGEPVAQAFATHLAAQGITPAPLARVTEPAAGAVALARELLKRQSSSD